jgi:hypothetical protein
MNPDKSLNKPLWTGAMHEWDQTVLKGPKQILRKAQRDLAAETDQKNHNLAKLIEKIPEKEEIKWQQRSRANWL